MHCTNCGISLSNEPKYCPSCGAETSSSETEPQLANETASPEARAASNQRETSGVGIKIGIGVLAVLGVLSIVGSGDPDSRLLILVLFGSWIAFSVVGLLQRWGGVATFGGGFVAACVVLTVTFATNSGPAGSEAIAEESNGTSFLTVASLEAQAMSKMDTFGLDFFCSKVIDKGVTNVSTGTATGGNGGTARFPAIKANYTGTCISQLNGDRDTEMVSNYWVFFSMDDEGDILRCYKILGDEKEIDMHAAGCDFKPDTA